MNRKKGAAPGLACSILMAAVAALTILPVQSLERAGAHTPF